MKRFFEDKKKSSLIFNIDKKLPKVFNFVLDYTDTDKTVLLEEWKESTDRQSIDTEQDSSDKAPVEIMLSDEEISDFNGFCKYILKTTPPDEWFESHVRKYCAKQLAQIQRELCSQCETINDIPPSIEEGNKKNLSSLEKHYLCVVGYVHARNWANELYSNIETEISRLLESSKKLNVAESCLRTSYRDQFDRLIKEEIDENHPRVGWRTTTKEIKTFFDEYKRKNKDNILQEARDILNL